MKNKYVLFLQVLMLALFILFLNCQQPETKIKYKTKYKTKVETVPVEVPVEVIKCGVIFNKQGGTGGSDSIMAIYGSAMPATTAPAKSGFFFAGYWDAASGGVQYYNIDMSSARNWDKTEDTVLYARWAENQNTVTFDKQGGTGGSDSITAIYGSAMPSATAPARTLFTFTGYWDAVSGGAQYYNADMSSARNWDKAEDTVLYARWAENQCTVTFDKRGGTGGSDSITAIYRYEMPAAIAPAKGGFFFTGYWDAVSGGVQYYNADMSGARLWDKTEDTVLYARWDWATYNLRDTGPAGGLIFYINPNAETDGWKYLECAPSTTEWTNKQWGKHGTSVGGTGTTVGTGKNNTALITAKLNEAPAESDRAAQLCDALSHSGYDDWFLPSKDELNLMYVNLKQQGVGGFADAYYWSSSESYNLAAWDQDFSDGSQGYSSKALNERVRAVRAF